MLRNVFARRGIDLGAVDGVQGVTISKTKVVISMIQ